LVHNHPSGDPTPSQADIQMTKEIVSVAQPLGISVHDHIIVGKKTCELQGVAVDSNHDRGLQAAPLVKYKNIYKPSHPPGRIRVWSQCRDEAAG
jgi:hypothetical protein